jgi:hypothetical protein
LAGAAQGPAELRPRREVLMLLAVLCALALVAPPQAESDPSRLVRMFVGMPKPTTEANPYLAERPAGSRMILASNASVLADLSQIRAAGVDLFFSRLDTLTTQEKAEDQWNWARPLAEREAAEAVDAAWGLSLHAAFPPAWQRQTYADDFMICLEHLKSVPGFSPWSGALRPFADRVWRAAATQFGRIPVATVGIHGQFGDAGLLTGLADLSETHRSQWVGALGSDHNHVGYWCGDTSAREEFTLAMLAKYGGLDDINKAWRSSIETASPLPYPTGTEYSYAARLDFMHWYREGVTRMAGRYLDAAKAACPGTLLLLPIGPPDDTAKLGVEISGLFEEAARHGAAVQLTTGGYHSFARNHALTLGLARAASRWFNLPIWLESAAPSDEAGFCQRLAEAIGLGAVGYYDWVENWQAHSAVSDRLNRFLTVGLAHTDVAVLYPTSSQLLRPDQPAPPIFMQGATQLRDYADFDVLDERLIQSGALSNYRVAILFEGSVWDERTLVELESWVKAGGVLLAYDFGKMTTPGGDAELYKELFPQAGTAGRAALQEQYEGDLPDAYEIAPGAGKHEWVLEGNWFMPEPSEMGETVRYTGPEATIKLPLKPGQDYSVTIRYWVPEEAAGLDRRVSFEGRLLGRLARGGESVYRFVIPGAWVTRPVGRLTVSCETWRPVDLLPQSSDTREIGIGVRRVTLRKADSAADPTELTGRFVSSVDSAQIRDQWTSSIGRGLTVFFPATRDRMGDYLVVARKLIYHLSEIDKARKDAPVIDDRRDGVYTTLLSDKLVFLNTTAKGSRRTMNFPDQPEPQTVTLLPYSAACASVGIPSIDLLLQCEKFVDTGDSQAIARPDCSPGEEDTAQVVPDNSPISTRFEISRSGSYTLFVRALRGPDLIVPQIVIDDLTLPVEEGAGKVGDVIRVGTVQLGQGVHSLVLSDSAAFTADFVILSNTPDLRGFRFPRKGQ